MKVTAGHSYRFVPSFWDKVDPKTNLVEGDIVKVKNMNGCPPANTMGCCHVVDPTTGMFIGLVSTDSLVQL